MTRLATSLAVLLASLLTACGSGSVASQTEDIHQTTPKENWKRDILSTDLSIDLETGRGAATIVVAPATRTGASFEIGDLEIEEVTSERGPVPFRVQGSRLDVGLAAKKPETITVRYRFRERAELQGAHQSGVTFTWPTFCGNLFPCKSNPSDGMRFDLSLTGVPEGAVAVYPEHVDSDAPAYMVAWAVGEYTKEALGTTSAGTDVAVWYLPGEATKARSGTKQLVKVFDWLERTYGAYAFGAEVGSVSAKWGHGAFGGMEHHPYWHVSNDSMGDPETHAHEAAHGWFGDGIRIACWEDLALSEGTVSYLTARALEAVSGASAGNAVWSSYQKRLDAVVADEDRVAWPEGCNEVDVLADLWNDVVYMKGAFFYRAVEAEIGKAALDRTIRNFYAEHQGGAARVADMLDAIEEETGFDARPLADEWLRSLGTPS